MMLCGRSSPCGRSLWNARVFGDIPAARGWLGGVVAFCGAAILSRPFYPATPQAHLAGWGLVLALALFANYGGLLLWFMRDPAAGRDRVQLLPALDACPAFMAAALLSAALISKGQYDLLFGVWMGMFGLVHAAYRRNLPPANLVVGLFYGAAGAVCLFHPAVRFVNPWPMGLVFLVGELSGGLVLIKGNMPEKIEGEEICDD